MVLTHIRTSREYSLAGIFFHLFCVFRQSLFIVLQYLFSISFSGWSDVVNASRAGTARSDAYKPQYRYCFKLKFTCGAPATLVSLVCKV